MKTPRRGTARSILARTTCFPKATPNPSRVKLVSLRRIICTLHPKRQKSANLDCPIGRARKIRSRCDDAPSTNENYHESENVHGLKRRRSEERRVGKERRSRGWSGGV